MNRPMLHVEEVAEGLTCLIDPTAQSPQNAFAWLASGGGETYLINAGWPPDVAAPPDLEGVIHAAVKVSNHYHHDWIKQWGFIRENVWISRKQSNALNCNAQGKGCRPALDRQTMICAPSVWLTFEQVRPFPVAHVYDDDAPYLGKPGSCVVSHPVSGHSQTDVALVHRPSRTLFLGDLYYVGGELYYFFPQGDVGKALISIEYLLTLEDWDYVAQISGEVFRHPRRYVEEYRAVLAKIVAGAATGASATLSWWDLPVYAYPFAYSDGTESGVAERLLGHSSS